MVELLAALGPVFMIVMVVLSILIGLAPLIIWRNTNRTNRLLTLMLLQQGSDVRRIKEMFEMDGGRLPSVVLTAIQEAEAQRKTAEQKPKDA